jgi:hypothetical protein
VQHWYDETFMTSRANPLLERRGARPNRDDVGDACRKKREAKKMQAKIGKGERDRRIVNAVTTVEFEDGDVRLVLEMRGIRQISAKSRQRIEDSLGDALFSGAVISEVLQDLGLMKMVLKTSRRR